MAIINRIGDLGPKMAEWRQHLHSIPELSFDCPKTSAFIRARLEEIGVDAIHDGIAQTGIVAIIEGQGDGPTIGLRADFDALPITEATGVAYASTHPGKMHACGHDGHTTMLLGAARHLSATRNFDGCVHFIFQPAEEGLGGALAMIKEGLFEQFPMDAVYGMHNGAGLPVGQFAIRPGPMMAGAAFFDIDIKGVGSHGARPENSIDPVVVASHIVTAIQSIVARNAKPTDTLVISVTKIHSGDAYNVIPQTAKLGGTVRCFSNEAMQLAEDRIGKVAAGVAESFGATATLDFRRIFDPLVNNADETEFCADIAAGLVGEENVNRNRSLVMASEDFSFMLQQRPGAFIYIGNGDGPETCMVHNPGYDFNDEILALGATYWVKLAEEKLAKDELAG